VSERAATCRYHIAAYGEIGLGCADRHGDREAEVARQLARRIHETEPTDEQVGWFMDDADGVCQVVPDEHPVVTAWNPNTMRLTISGYRFRVADEGGGLLFVSGPKPKPTP